MTALSSMFKAGADLGGHFCSCRLLEARQREGKRNFLAAPVLKQVQDKSTLRIDNPVKQQARIGDSKVGRGQPQKGEKGSLVAPVLKQVQGKFVFCIYDPDKQEAVSLQLRNRERHNVCICQLTVPQRDACTVREASSKSVGHLTL